MDFMSFFANGFISKRRFGRKPALGQFFFLSFPDVFRKQSDIILGCGDFNSPHKPFVRLGVFVKSTAFFHQMNGMFFIGQYPFVDHRHIREVTGQTIGCFHEDRVDLGFGYIFQHLMEYFSLDFSGGRFLNSKNLRELKAVPVGIVMKEFFLSRQRVAGVLLIL
ncbi:MAG: hypothetical protein AUK21_04510 [Parcubacteria group bacterium CG2_30_48_51]|nr:MAG: hypothetical protein AUK21_04510 [Parcubacteria group bacterium CG2_30_48_51]